MFSGLTPIPAPAARPAAPTAPKPGTPALTENEAFASIALVAVCGGREPHSADRESLELVLPDLHHFQEFDDAVVERTISSALVLLHRYGHDGLIQRAGAVLSEPLKASAYAVAADLILDHGRTPELENQQLNRIASGMGVSLVLAHQIDEVVHLQHLA